MYVSKINMEESICQPRRKEKKEKAASLFLVCHKAADRADACCAGRFWILLFWRICGSDTADAPWGSAGGICFRRFYVYPSQTCSVFDKDGKLISERRGDKNAQYVKYEDIPKNFVAAIISIEDKKFYQHNGVDLKGLVRAVKATVMSKLKKSQGGTQGGSTITMQLAKLIYMQPKQTWQYKVKQMFLAWELEKTLQ